ncbi:T9SS type A sorting domain-containing protein [Hymenobacter algoricola]|uniref:T9SS type A sorting domain-containing protein n=1 Tax=Hymenobacter algoricola TaxID=486267 RepID=A0ABP7MQW1_9BACT
MKTLCLLVLLLPLLASLTPGAAQTRHLPAPAPTRLEAALQHYSPRLRLAAAPSPARRPGQTSLTRPGRGVVYDWNAAAGAWQDPQVILYAYNAQGQPSLETRADSATAVPSFRLQYTYNAQNQLTEALQQDYFGTAWTNSFRQTTAFDAQGNATEELGQDWISGAWSTTFGSRYVNTYTAGNFLAQQVVQTFDAATTTFADDYRVSYKVPVAGPYTEFTVQRWNAGQWQDESRVTAIVWHSAERQLPLSLEVQIPINAVWVSVQRLTAAYQPNGSSVAITELRPNPSGPWLNDARTTDTYDAYDNQTDLLHETWDGTAWILNDRYHALLTYDAQHVVLRRDEQLATGSSGGQLINQRRFNFGSFLVIPLATTAGQLPALRLSLYPNPTAGPATLELTGPGSPGPLTAEVRNALGQVVATLLVRPGQPTRLPRLPAGVYAVLVPTAQGRLVGRLMQQ